MYIVKNYMNYYMTREYPMWMSVKKASSIVNSNSNIIIGDSRAKAGLIANDMGWGWESYALGGGTPIEGFYTLKRVIDSKRKINSIIVSYGAFHLMQQDSYWHRTNKFSFLEVSDYIEVESKASYFKDIVLGNEKHWYDYKFKVGMYYGDVLKAMKGGVLSILNNRKVNEKIFEELKGSKGHYYFGRMMSSSALNQEANFSNFHPSPLLNWYLERLIHLARVNNIKIYWASMPYNSSSFNVINEKFTKDFDLYIKNKMFDKVLLLTSSMPDDCFGDSNHLYSCSPEFTGFLRGLIYNDE